MARPSALCPVLVSVDSLQLTDITTGPTGIEPIWPKPLTMTIPVWASKTPRSVFSALVSWAWDVKASEQNAAAKMMCNLFINSFRYGNNRKRGQYLKLRQFGKVAGGYYGLINRKNRFPVGDVM